MKGNVGMILVFLSILASISFSVGANAEKTQTSVIRQFNPAKEQRKIKAVIFDIGNVVIKVNLELQWAGVLKKLGIDLEPSDQKFKEIQKKIDSYIVGHVATKDLIAFISEQGGLKEPISLNNFRSAWNSVIVSLNEDAIDTINRLRKEGYLIYTLSDTNELHFEFMEEIYRRTHSTGTFRALFDHCYLSFETGHRKSQDEAWLDILNPMLTASESFFIDDIKLNIDKASRLNFATFHYQPESTMADVITTIKEINMYNK